MTKKLKNYNKKVGKMSKIDELIAKLCPDGVEYIQIEELLNIKYIFTVSPPKKLTKSEFRITGKYPIIDQGQNFVVGYTDEINFTLPKDNYVIFGDHTEAIKFVDFQFTQGADGIKIIKTDSDFIRSKFFFYALNAFYIKTGKYTRHYGFVKKTEIPFPPLPIQDEIVKILDNFTSLEAELEAELEARTRQYEFYRNQLLAFESKDVEWKTLGEVGTFTRGKRFVRTDMIEQGFPCIHYGEMYTHYNVFATESKSFVSPELASKLRVANYGDVVIVAAGETIEDIGKGTAWLGESDVVTHDACFTFKSPLNPKYVAYFSRTLLFHDQIKRHISSGKISAINAKGLEKAKIPVPPLAEQERIVDILDKFDALVNDISVGLPAEIKARRQQYEYYRGRLLSFKEIQKN